MEANDFLVKIKANGNSKDWDDLAEVYSEYKNVILKLSTKDRGTFSLNVLCLLCRNLDKVPSWKDAVDSKDLLTLSIDCIRETRGLNKAEQVKTLACIYHIHRHVVRKNTPIPPELILKISFMAFEVDSTKLLKEYCKTYWNILADRLSYIEKLKGKSVHKLLPKLTEDILKTIDIYDTLQFCTNIIVFLFKKLHSIYSDCNAEQLNMLYGEIFKKISGKSDLSVFKKLKDTDLLDLYVKLSDCLYVTAENASKNNFKHSSMSIGVRTAISLLGHRSDMFHCLQTFYLNSFCDLFENRTSYVDALFKNLTTSCEITEKLGYKDTMLATYAFLNQFLRLYIEYSVTNSIKANFTMEIQENCLNFMLKIIEMLKYSQQLLKCENCSVKSGLHDALRLSFLLKHFITHSLQNNIDISNLTMLYNKIVNTQYTILNELKELKCTNNKKFFMKLQTDTHNIAILLNKHQKYDFSIELFEIYIKNELSLNNKGGTCKRNEFDAKNVSRALYNKSICELDSKQYEKSLLDAFLSLIFAEDQSTEKYMSLVMDIKAKSLKNDKNDDENVQNDHLQLLTVMEACQIVVDKGLYGNIKQYLMEVKFCGLLKHEFLMYVKLWPSIVPIAGVWKSLQKLLEGDREKWMYVEDENTILWTLLEVVSLTPSAVRTINNDYFKEIVMKLLNRIDKIPDPVPVDIKVVQTTLLFLKAEYDVAFASTKYGWKITENSTTDPDQIQITRTMQQEHEALRSAIQGVELWTEVATEINTVSKTRCLIAALQLAEVFVQQMLYFGKLAYGLQLAHVCCEVAKYIEQKEIYIRNVGVLAYHIHSVVLQDAISLATDYWPELIHNEDSIETSLIFISDVAIYYYKCGSVGTAAKLLQLAQTRILKAYENHPDINLDLAVGNLMEAQSLMCKQTGPSLLTAVNGLQRHYLSVANNSLTWLPRRLRAITTKYKSSINTLNCARYCSKLSLYRRSRAACSCSIQVLGTNTLARGYSCTVNTYNMQQAQVIIDNKLKYIVGLSTEPQTTINEPKIPLFAPKQELEVMLENQPFKSLSPTRKYIQIPGYHTPEFLKHKNCDCFACDDLNCCIISYIIGGLDSSTYFRGNELEIARNYYHGIVNSFNYFEPKLKFAINKYTEMDFEKYIVEHVKNVFEDEFKVVRLEILIEASYFELKCRNFDQADDYIVCIHEILQDMKKPDGYLHNEVMNLMIASAKVRNVAKKHEISLETEFENLKLSPKGDVPKTPITKPKLPVISSKKVTVIDEEIPKKRKVIKLNLDEGSSDEKEQEKPKPRKPEFKIPVPVTSKPVLENITPRVTRKPDITITDTAKTPKTDVNDKFSEFFTPQSTPEQFFTPMATIKTYSKGNLRRGIVKNLEEEFSTPVGKGVKEEKLLEVPTRSGRKVENQKTLQRATSPGKLNENKTRPRRLRQPKLNDD